MISIYTRTNNPFKKEFWKWLIKKALKKYSGPDAVLDSLKRGLTKLCVPFEINPLIPKYDVIHVLAGPEALKTAIKTKRVDQILLAGPNIITLPLDQNKIISNDIIDVVLVPSDWVKDFYLSLLPQIKNKIHTWPAGVKIPPEISNGGGEVIILKKQIENSIVQQVLGGLHKKGIPFEVLEYGSFSQKKYLDKLKTAPFLIYLQASESQGIALQEAWSYNVPTLVYQNTEWKNGSYSWRDAKISAPYLSPETGLFFNNNTLDSKLSKIQEVKNPRAYCENHLSDIKSVTKLLEIIRKTDEKNN